jgi:DNA primase
LLCALVLPEADSSRALAAERLGANPEWFADLPTAPVMEVLVSGPAPDNPFDAAPDAGSRALLASALQAASEVPEPIAGVLSTPLDPLKTIAGALETLHDRYIDRRLRELRIQMSEAQRRGDDAMLLRLAQEKLRFDRERKR